MGASARRAGLSPTLVMLLYLAGQCAYFSIHIPPLDQWNSEGFSPSSCGRILSLPEFQFQDLSPLAFPAGSPEKESVVFEPPLRDFFLDGHWRSNPRPRPKTFKFLGVAGGAIERSCYSPCSPHYVNTVPRETMRETTRQLCLRAAQQQTGASPVTAVAIGSGNAALVG